MKQIMDHLASERYRLEEPALLRAAATCVALFTYLMPWTTLDGATSSTSGAALFAMAFTGAETSLMIKVSLLPSMTLFSVPVVTAFLTVYAALRTISHTYPIAPNAISLALALTFLIATAPITSSDTPRVLGTPLPAPGLALFMVTQALLTAHGIFTKGGNRPGSPS